MTYPCAQCAAELAELMNTGAALKAKDEWTTRLEAAKREAFDRGYRQGFEDGKRQVVEADHARALERELIAAMGALYEAEEAFMREDYNEEEYAAMTRMRAILYPPPR